jgi:ribosome-associated protein
MSEDTTLRVTPAVEIPLAELAFQASRSGGPGGQHVNTSSTRVELWWDLLASPSLTEAERARVRRNLANRLTAGGQLRVVSGATRSQARNRVLALERFRELVARALAVPKRRRPTRPSRAVKERRLAEKRQRGERKRQRRKPGNED